MLTCSGLIKQSITNLLVLYISERCLNIVMMFQKGEIHWPIYLKEQMIFSHRYSCYCNICPVSGPLIRSPVIKTVPSFCRILKKHRSLNQEEFQDN